MFIIFILCLAVVNGESICKKNINKQSCAKLCKDKACGPACFKYCHKSTQVCDNVQSTLQRTSTNDFTQGIKTVDQCKANKLCKCFQCSVRIPSKKSTSCTTSMCLINIPTKTPSSNGIGVPDACKPLMPVSNSQYQVFCSMLKAGPITPYSGSYVTPVWGETQCDIIYDIFGTLTKLKCVPC